MALIDIRGVLIYGMLHSDIFYYRLSILKYLEINNN